MNSDTFRSFLGSKDYPSVILKLTDTRELESICSLFSPRKPPVMIIFLSLWQSIHFTWFSAPLANMINLSLVKGIFPDKLKIRKVIPIYKTENPSLFVNYIPISLLPNFSKIFEKFTYNRLVEFAETNKYFIFVSLVFVKITRHHMRYLLNGSWFGGW